MGACAQMRREHDEHADEADRHRAPAIDAHLFLEDERGQNHYGERRGIADRDSLRERQELQGREAAEHAGRAHDAALEMAAQIAGLQGVRQLGAPGEPDEQRDHREEGADEDDLAGRIARRDRLDASRHQREGQRRDQLEGDAEKRRQSARPKQGNGFERNRPCLDHVRAGKRSVNSATRLGQWRGSGVRTCRGKNRRRSGSSGR